MLLFFQIKCFTSISVLRIHFGYLIILFSIHIYSNAHLCIKGKLDKYRESYFLFFHISRLAYEHLVIGK